MSIGKQITVWRVRPNDMQAIAPGEVLNTGYDLILKSEHDAALRRAKAEGVREARARIEHAFEHGDIVQDVLDDLDARAAKIEEGDK